MRKGMFPLEKGTINNKMYSVGSKKILLVRLNLELILLIPSKMLDDPHSSKRLLEVGRIKRESVVKSKPMTSMSFSVSILLALSI
jgi:hypothetical protein